MTRDGARPRSRNELAKACAREGAAIDATLEVIEGGAHIWQYVGPDLPETRQSGTSADRFLSRYLCDAGA